MRTPKLRKEINVNQMPNAGHGGQEEEEEEEARPPSEVGAAVIVFDISGAT
jgi:hypothetical protein